MSDKKNNTKRLAGLAIFGAIIIFLQLFATFVKFGPISITLALTPIVVGAAAYGISAGAILGAVMGGVTLVGCIFGWDIGGNILWAANPLLTALLCFVKAGAAGFVSGVV
ncbi:MAG: ECF transporter S component, partial [Oscillospiraceae bacterium]|nr:ECF transporter S component [Oscillospiraceae bacterium]